MHDVQAGQPPAGSALALALAEVADDDADGADGDRHVCMVCKEGYQQQPVRLVGACHKGAHWRYEKFLSSGYGWRAFR